MSRLGGSGEAIPQYKLTEEKRLNNVLLQEELFDGSWIGNKFALSFKLFCKGMSANETVIVKRRIDHANADIATVWTTFRSNN